MDASAIQDLIARRRELELQQQQLGNFRYGIIVSKMIFSCHES